MIILFITAFLLILGIVLYFYESTSSSSNRSGSVSVSKTLSVDNQEIANSENLTEDDYNSEISSYTPINPPPILTDDSDDPISTALRDPEFWISLTLGQIDPPRIAALAKWIRENVNSLRTKITTKFSTSTMVVDRINRNAVQTFIHRLGLRPTSQAITKAVTRAGTTIADATALMFSPGAWFAFEVVSGTLDQMLGAYQDVEDKKHFETSRDIILRYAREEVERQNERWPIPIAPHEIEKLKADDFLQMMSIEYEDIYTKNTALKNRILSEINDIYIRTNVSLEEKQRLADEHIDSIMFQPALENIARRYNGKIINMHGKLWITYKSKQDTDGYNNEYENEYFPMWTDDQGGYAYRGPLLLKMFCENLGYDTTLNKQEYLCRPGPGFCERNGTSQNRSTGFCEVSRGQMVAESIFGQTVTRGLVQVFDTAQYAPCPEGSTQVGAYMCQSDSGQLKVYPRGVTIKKQDPCPSGWNDTGASTCEKCTNPGLPYLKLGRCYRDGNADPGLSLPPDDESCPPDGHPDYTQLQGKFCYHRNVGRLPGSNLLKTSVPSGCPDNYDTCPLSGGLAQSAACYRLDRRDSSGNPSGSYCCIDGGPRPWPVCVGNTSWEKPKDQCREGYRRTGGPAGLTCEAIIHNTKKSCPDRLVLDNLGVSCVGSDFARTVSKSLSCPSSHPTDINGSCYAPCRTGLVPQVDNEIMCVDENHRGFFRRPRLAEYAQPDREKSPFGRMEQDFKNCDTETCRAKAATYMAFAIFPLVTGNGLPDLVNLVYAQDVYLQNRNADEE